jgi:hypothetical protein
MIIRSLMQPVIAVAALIHTACSLGPQTAELQSSQIEQTFSSELINEEIGATIANEMQKKCGALFASGSVDFSECSRAATQMSKTLDFNYVKNQSGQSAFVFMSAKLLELLKDEQVIKFIATLQSAAEDALYLGQPFNLWDLALASSGMSPEIATERLAVLIQDGAETAAQIKFLFVIRHPQAMALYAAVQALEAALREQKATAYPPSLNTSRTALYHYYVPRYLAQELKRKKFKDDMAVLLPLMFNASYELHQIQKSENPSAPLNHRPVTPATELTPELRRLVDKWNRYDELFSDLLDHLAAPLEPYDHTRQSVNNEDIFLGYAGSLSGVQATAIPQAQTEFVTEFARNPIAWLTDNIP